jgi:hypothetical protein
LLATRATPLRTGGASEITIKIRIGWFLSANSVLDRRQVLWCCRPAKRTLTFLDESPVMYNEKDPIWIRVYDDFSEKNHGFNRQSVWYDPDLAKPEPGGLEST